MVIDVLIIVVAWEPLLLPAVGWPLIPSVLILVFVPVPSVSVGTLATMALPSIIVVPSLTVVTLGMAVGSERSIIIPLHPSRICSDLITDLSTLLAAAKLATWFESVVPVHPDHHAIAYGTVQGVDSQGCLCPCCILDKAEATGLHLHSVESHNQIDNMSTLAEVL